jgi:hypothetical protein
MNAWHKYESDLAEQRRKERMDYLDEIAAIRKACGIEILKYSDEPTETEHGFLHDCGISWEGDNRGR